MHVPVWIAKVKRAQWPKRCFSKTPWLRDYYLAEGPDLSSNWYRELAQERGRLMLSNRQLLRWTHPLTCWLFVWVEWFLIPSPKEGNISVGMFLLETSYGLCLGDFEKWQHHHTMNVGLFHCFDVGFLEERGYWKLRQICLAYNSVFADRYHGMLKTADGRAAG